jgi:hypothetical protein
METSAGDARQAGEAQVSRTAHQIEALLSEADRMMMQTVQVSLSLIGFGFTINAFFNDFAMRSAGAAGSRRVGIAMLALGLWYLAAGLLGQVGFRRRATRRLKAVYAPAEAKTALRRPVVPAFTLAFALLALSVAALTMMLLREFR